MITFNGKYCFIEILSNQDQQICTYLEEKLHIYAELGELSGFEDVHLEPHLLIKPDPGEPPQAASLLAAALKEGKLLLKGFGLTNPENVYREPTISHALWSWCWGYNRIRQGPDSPGIDILETAKYKEINISGSVRSSEEK